MTSNKLFLSLLLAGAIGSASAQNLKEAKAAMQAEQYDKAKGMLQQLVVKKAKDGQNYFYLGQIHLINDKIDSAAIVFNEGVTNAPNEKLNVVGLGIVDLYKGNEAAAQTKFTTATSNLGKKDYLPLFYVGRAYIDAPKPDFTKAIEYLTQAKAKNAKDAEVSVALGDAYSGLRESNQAYLSYSDALDIDGTLIDPKIGQAIISRRAQAYDIVLEQLATLGTENPNYAPIYRELAETYYLSSLKAPEEDYREINQKAVENYKKYLSLTGDNSVEAKTRYADFLVYSGNYDELKTVSQELANAPGVDAKVFRYLGYIAYNQDKDYAKSAEYLKQLFEKVQPERLIPRDYLYAGLANIGIGNNEEGTRLLKEAIAKQAEEDDLLAEISETAFAKYTDGDVPAAIGLFAIPASMPESDYYYDANYYIGLGEYGIGSKILAVKEGEPEVEDGGLAKLAEAKPHLEKAVAALGAVTKATKQEDVDKYYIPALYYKGLAELGLDNVMYNPEEAKGLFVDSFTKLIEAVKAKPDVTNANEYLIDANNYLAFYAYYQGDNAKAKALFGETLKVNPEDEFALQFYDQL
ncbi:tetratricopeptide repeat protein [Sphingobacterium hungaricum]